MHTSEVHALFLCAAVWVVVRSERENAHRTFQRFLAAHGPGHRLGVLAYRFWTLLKGRVPPELVSEVVTHAARFDDGTWVRDNKGDGLLDRWEAACGTAGLNRTVPPDMVQIQALEERLRDLLPTCYDMAGNGTILVPWRGRIPVRKLHRLLGEAADKLESPYAQALRDLATRLGTAPERTGLEPLRDVLLDIERTLDIWQSRV